MAEEGEQKETRFNMAIATLQRIHISLERMRIVFETIPHGLERQRHHISQIKIFFQNATPLLKKETVKKLAPEIDGLKLSSKVLKGRSVYFFDVNKEKRLFEIVREIEMELKPFFMPDKKEDDDDY